MKKPKEKSPNQLSNQQQKFLKLYAKYKTISPCANMVGVSRSEVQTWKLNSPEFVREIERIDDDYITFLFEHICTLARNGNREARKLIRDQYGTNGLKYVMDGNNLKLKARHS